MIVEFGKRILRHPDVDGISIDVSFKDDSKIDFHSKFKTDIEKGWDMGDIEEDENDGR